MNRRFIGMLLPADNQDDCFQKWLKQKTVWAAKMSKLLTAILLAMLLGGCAKAIQNVGSVNDLQANNKILAGRFVFYNNDEIVREHLNFMVHFNRQGDSEIRVFQPDREGYVYVSLPAGQYNMGLIRVVNYGDFNFKLDPFPEVKIMPDDAIVNFGTIEVRFYQGTGSKVAALLLGIAKAHLNVSYTPDFEVTRPEISSRLADFCWVPVDREITFLERGKKSVQGVSSFER